MTQTRTPILKKTTDCQDERAARDLAILNEYNALIADPEQSRTKANEYLMQKYGIHSTGTLYAIRKRAEERINRQRSNAV